ncbi:hypothetical protein FNH08_03455, partial [Streptomyces spongiae]|nr:hypothetical protein [Streptomyces spongiae]
AYPPNSLVPVADTVPDVPSVLRAWSGSPAEQELVAEELAAGNMVRIATSDDTTEYELLAESIDALRMQRTGRVIATPAA